MAQKVKVTLVCDLLHESEVNEDVSTLSFAIDGASYEIEGCPEHEQGLRAALAEYIERARKAPGGMPPRAKPARTAAERGRNDEIRAWAKGRGYKVSDRGRIAAPIVTEYETSHS